MEAQKTVLIADFDKFGRFGTKTVCSGIENVEVMTASTKEEALQVINGDEIPDLVIVDPVYFRRGQTELREDSLEVITAAVSRGIRVLIVTVFAEGAQNKLSKAGMGGSYCDIVEKGKGPEVTRDAILKALAD